MKRSIEKIIERIPPLPGVVLSVMKLTKDHSASASRIAMEISKDPIIAAEVIRIINSPAYGFSREITSIEHAVALLGTSTLERLVLSVYVKRIQGVEVKSFKQERGELNAQAFLGAYASKLIASMRVRKLEDNAFTSASVRLIGKIGVNYILGPNIKEVMEKVRKGKSFHVAEKEVIGINHIEMGELIARKWNFPEDIVKVIKYFNEPAKFTEEGDTKKLVYIVHAGDRVAMMTGVGAGIDNMLYTIDKTVFNYLNLTEVDLRDVFSKVAEESESIVKELCVYS